MTRTTSSRESSSLANCSPLHARVHCRMVLYSPPKKLVFVPVASAMAGGHRDCPVLASVHQWPWQRYSLLFLGVKSLLLTSCNGWMDGRTNARTDSYNLNIMMWYQECIRKSMQHITSFPGSFPAFQCCMLKSKRKAWYVKSRDGEKRWEKVQSTSRIKGHRTCKHYSLQTTKDMAISHEWNAVLQGLRVYVSVDRRYRECQNGSVHMISIDLHFVRIMPRQHRSWHATRDFTTRPSSRFSACNIEKLGMGLGTRLCNTHSSNENISLWIWHHSCSSSGVWIWLVTT